MEYTPRFTFGRVRHTVVASLGSSEPDTQCGLLASPTGDLANNRLLRAFQKVDHQLLHISRQTDKRGNIEG